MTFWLCGVFFLSGASALIFENLWFYQSGIAFGSSVWASSLVLAGFMGGLALGNGLVGRFGYRVRRPLRLYAGLEAIIGLAGLALVLGLPALTPALAVVFAPIAEQPWLVNPLRFGTALLLLLLPATAMGCTLPLVVAALFRRDPDFGRVLGLLYGWNTLGAVIGALAPDAFLVEALGVRGTALAAGGLNAISAAVALGLARRGEAASQAPPESAPRRPSPRALALLCAAALSGFVLLALEVVWFRFLLLFVRGSSTSFAVMLAVVLVGIGVGGLVASRWLALWPGARRALPGLSLLSGALCVLGYASFAGGDRVLTWQETGMLAASLMLPVSLVSGVVFTLLGEAINAESPGETRAAGLLTLANTGGAMLGSLVAGFVLLPGLGVERSLWWLAGGYGAVALLLALGGGLPSGLAGRALSLAGAIALGASLLLFPSGAMEQRFLRPSIELFQKMELSQPVATREGLTETIVYMRRAHFGEPLYYRLLTNGFSMSATDTYAQRYMKLFVYLPVALREPMESALLISYGVGTTASALVQTRSLEHIDVVDISADVLELNRHAFPDGGFPLDDPRVQVHIEDGRYFLQTTDRRFDLITGEPPPPKWAGIVSLYTREYFQLVRDRLNPGGMVSYWLPVHSLVPRDAEAITRGFCDVFPDCSLWTGSGLDWILLGSNDAGSGLSEAGFRRQWSDPVVGPDLRAIGLERPEQLGALFMADAAGLAQRVGDAAPLVDDHPKRLSDELEGRDVNGRAFQAWMDTEAARRAFADSDLVARMWPAALREASLPWFEQQVHVNRNLLSQQQGIAHELPAIHALLSKTQLVTLPLWLLGSTQQWVDAAQRAEGRTSGPVLDLHLGRARLARRDFAGAAERFARARAAGAQRPGWLYLQLYSLCMAGRLDEARELAAPLRVSSAPGHRRTLAFLDETFGLAKSQAEEAGDGV